MLRAAIALGLLTFFPSSVSAGLVTWEFAGTVTFVSDSTGFLGGGVTVGSPFSGLYTFDSTVLDSSKDPLRGTYNDAITGVSGQVADLEYLGPVVGENFISVLDNSFGADAYGGRSIVRLLDVDANFELTLVDEESVAFSDDSMLLVPPDLADLETKQFVLFSELESFSIGGELTLLVPEPTTLTLLGIAAFVCSKRRRKRAK